jgi:hypothetical protein
MMLTMNVYVGCGNGSEMGIVVSTLLIQCFNVMGK